MEQTPQEYYRILSDETSVKLNITKKAIYTIGTIRLLIVVLTAIGIFWGSRYPIIIPVLIGITGICLFLFFMVIHDKYFRRKSYLDAILSICNKEMRLHEYRFDGTNDGSSFEPSTHDFSRDLDLFGPKSLYAYMERSATEIGNRRFIHMMLHPLTDAKCIRERQVAIAELSDQTPLRIDFLANGLTGKRNDNDLENAEQFAQSGPIISGRAIRITVALLPFIYILLIALTVAGIVPGILIFYLFLAMNMFAFFRSKRITIIQTRLTEQLKSLNTYARLIQFIEQGDFKSELLRKLNKTVQSDGTPVSTRIRRLGKLMANLDQRFGVFGFIFLNGFLLWDFKQLLAIELWKKENAPLMKSWLETVAGFDALCALGTFRFNHPDYRTPIIAENDQPLLQAKGLGHPLIPRNICVRNSIDMERRPEFLVITGANMAGKSTYLRTIGVNWMLASMGAPVCAESMAWTPCTLFTSLRTTDSLTENESYFFAELKRLKQMADRLKSGEKMFVILDEILKGTNSADKQKGSMALIKQLIGLHAAGVIATHDLLLGTLAENYPEQIKNFRFEANITNDELTFSYLIQPGIAQNMNAFFLMKKMGIIPRETNP